MLLNFPLLKLWGPESIHNIYNVPLEPERAAKARRAVVASVFLIGDVNSKKLFLIKCSSTDFTLRLTDLPNISCMASIWNCNAALTLVRLLNQLY